MAAGDVPVEGTLTPTDRALDTYPITEDTFGKRGFRVVLTTVEMNAIPAPRRGQGMWCKNLQDGIMYELQADLTTWTPVTIGGTGTVVTGLDVTGTLPTLTLIPSGVTAGSYGTASNVPQIIFDAKGRATSAANVPIVITQAAVTGLTADLALKEDKANKGIANGYVPLNGANMIDPAYYISGTGLVPKGDWDVVTNTPALADGTGSLGWWYVVVNSANPTVRDLGSGNISFYDDDWVIHDGTIYVKNGSGVPATTGITTINTDSSALTGATVALNSTAQIADSAGRRYQTDLQKSIQDAAVTAGATVLNRYALLSEVNTPITVTNEWNTPERYGDGTNTVGTTLGSRLLNTLINPATGVNYTNASAATRWNLVTGIDVTSWEYDEVCVDQMMRGMELASGSSAATFHDNRVYMYRQSHNMARVSQTSSTYRPVSWVYNGNGSRHYNISGQARTLWKRTPTNQTEAVGAPNPFTSYKVIMRDMMFSGANLGVENSGDCCVEISATYGTVIENVDCLKADTGLKIFFGLGARVIGGHYSENSRSGILVATGAGYGSGPIWSGAGLTNSASNGAYVAPSRVATNNGGFAGVEAYCADGITIGGDVPGSYEGQSGSVVDHHVYFEAQGATTCKALTIQNLHLEQAVSQSHICISQDPAQRITAYIDGILPYLVPTAPTMFEARTNGTNARVCMVISNCPNKDTGWKFRQTGSTSATNWFVDLVQFADVLNPYNAINWNTAGGGVIPANGFFNQQRIAP